MSDLIQKAKRFLFGRRIAYLQTFNKDNPNAVRVLVDLAKFCRANETTFHADARVTAVLEGRREVFLRIQQHIQLTDDELWKLYGGNNE